MATLSMMCAAVSSRALPPNQRWAFNSSGKPASKRALTAPSRSFRRMSCSQEIVEILFSPHPAPQTEYLCGNRVRINQHVVPRPLPEIVRVGQQIMRLKRPGRVYAQNVQIQLEPAAVDMVRA